MVSFLNALPGAVSQGLVWGIMAIGLFITFKLLEVSDLTVDGSFCTGGAVCVMLVTGGVNVWIEIFADVRAAMAGQGYDFLSLFCEKENKEAVAFWQSQGFQGVEKEDSRIHFTRTI